MTKHSVQQKGKKVMEEKAGRPKRPDNILPLLMPNYEQKNKFVKKQTNKRYNYETRQGTMLKKD